jgi:hypothetical protein
MSVEFGFPIRGECRVRVLQNMVVWKIPGPKKETVAGRNKVHNEKFYIFCSVTDITEFIKSRRMRWVGHAAHIGQMRNAYAMLLRNRKGVRPFGMQGMDRIILE